MWETFLIRAQKFISRTPNNQKFSFSSSFDCGADPGRRWGQPRISTILPRVAEDMQETQLCVYSGRSADWLRTHRQVFVTYLYWFFFLSPHMLYMLPCMVPIFIILARVIIMARVFLTDCNSVFVPGTCNCNGSSILVMIWGDELVPLIVTSIPMSAQRNLYLGYFFSRHLLNKAIFTKFEVHIAKFLLAAT